MKQEENIYLKYAHYPWIKGPILGASMMISITPLLKWSNLILQGEKIKIFPLRAHMSGAMSYASSVVPSYAMTFLAKSLLDVPEHQLHYQLGSSFLAGAISGFACTPFENIAQNKQLMGYTSNQLTLEKIYQHHGVKGLFQGALSIVAREGLWAGVYLTAIPFMIKYLTSNDYSFEQSNMLASIAVAGSFGLLTSPLNQLRFKKQEGLCQAKQTSSYFESIKAIWQQAPDVTTRQRLSFFYKGAGTRALTTTCAGAFMVKATVLYDGLLH